MGRSLRASLETKEGQDKEERQEDGHDKERKATGTGRSDNGRRDDAQNAGAHHEATTPLATPDLHVGQGLTAGATHQETNGTIIFLIEYLAGADHAKVAGERRCVAASQRVFPDGRGQLYRRGIRIDL